MSSSTEISGLFLDHKTSDPNNKPDGKLFGWKYATRPPDAWVEALTKGFTIVPGTFIKDSEDKYRHKEEFWKGTFMLCLDADNIVGEKGELPEHNAVEPWTDPNGLLERYPTLKERAFAVTESVSSMVEKRWKTKGVEYTAAPCRRHRIIFVFDTEITDGKQYRAIQRELYQEFNIIPPVERQPAQPVFGNCREGFNISTFFGNVIEIPEIKGTTQAPKEQPQRQKQLPRGSNYLKDWLVANNVDFTETKESNKFQIDCPWGDEHSDGICNRNDAFVKEYYGKWYFHCSHATCKSNKRNLRQFTEALELNVAEERLAGNPYFDNGIFQIKQMADDVTENEHLWLEKLNARDTDLLIYNKETGVYELAERVLERKIRAELEDKQSSRYVSETLKYIDGIEVPKPFSENRGLIAFKNGVLDFDDTIQKAKSGEFKNWELREKNPEDYLRTYYDFDFIVGCNIPEFFETFVTDVTASETDAKLIFQMFGAMLHKNCTDFEKAFFLYGTISGRNGKSTLLNTIPLLIGAENVLAKPFQKYDATKNNFGGAELKGFSVALDVDLSLKTALSEDLKPLISGDEVALEAKNKQESIRFKPSALFIAAANDVPKVSDRTGSFYRRWIPIPFHKEFPDNRDFKADFLQKCIEHRSEIMSSCLELYLIACIDDNFTVSEETEKITKEWMDQNNHLRVFFEEMFIAEEVARIEGKELAEIYREWCEEAELNYTATSHQLHKAFREHFKVEKRALRFDGKVRQGYEGVGLKTEEDDETLPL